MTCWWQNVAIAACGHSLRYETSDEALGLIAGVSQSHDACNSLRRLGERLGSRHGKYAGERLLYVLVDIANLLVLAGRMARLSHEKLCDLFCFFVERAVYVTPSKVE